MNQIPRLIISSNLVSVLGDTEIVIASWKIGVLDLEYFEDVMALMNGIVQFWLGDIFRNYALNSDWASNYLDCKGILFTVGEVVSFHEYTFWFVLSDWYNRIGITWWENCWESSWNQILSACNLNESVRTHSIYFFCFALQNAGNVFSCLIKRWNFLQERIKFTVPFLMHIISLAFCKWIELLHTYTQACLISYCSTQSASASRWSLSAQNRPNSNTPLLMFHGKLPQNEKRRGEWDGRSKC